MKTIMIEDVPGTDFLLIQRDPELCSVRNDKQVQWASESLEDWCVIFGPQAPLYPKVATPHNPELKLVGKRPEDFRHCKYVVVAWDGEKLKHKDPELIVET